MKGKDTRATNQSKLKRNAMVSNSMEHHQTNQTRIGHNHSANDNPGTYYLIAKRIDRIYSSVLPWQAINLKIKSHTPIEVTRAEVKFGSDHAPVAPVAINITTRRQIPRDQRPIPHWLAKHPIYAETLQALLEKSNPELIEEPFSRIEAINSYETSQQKKLRKILNNVPDSP